jgi:hypothetical protein
MFLAWPQALYETTDGEIIAIDSKTLRCSFDQGFSVGYPHHEITAIHKFVFASFVGGESGSSPANRGHEHQRSMRRLSTCVGRLRCLGGVQRGGGTYNDSSSRTVQQ